VIALDVPVIWLARFEIPKIPKPKPRHKTRIVKTRAGRVFAHHYPDSAGEEDARTIISLAAPHAPGVPYEGPVVVSLLCRLLPGESWPRWKLEAALAIPPRVFPMTKNRGDVDNLEKQVMDALTSSGRWWRDDGQVIESHVRKIYSATPGIDVEVRFLAHVATQADWKARVGTAGAAAGPEPARQATPNLFGEGA